MKLKLIRVEKSDTAIISVLTVDGLLVPVLYVLEHPVLCVPAGAYPLIWDYSPKFQRDLWELNEVPGRSECKFHKGNTMKDTEGCLIVGTNLGYMDGLRAVLYSGTALNNLHVLLPANEQHELEIVGV